MDTILHMGRAGCAAFIVMTLFAGCVSADRNLTGNDGVEYVEHASPVEYIAITSKGGSQVTFMTHASWGNSCGSFSRAVISNSDSGYSIQIVGRQRKDAVCLAVMSVFTAPVTVFLPSPGAYRFKFWRSDAAYLDTTFTVK